MNLSMKQNLRRYAIPALLVFLSLGVAIWQIASPVTAAVTYSWDSQPGYPLYEDVGFGCTSHSTCTTSCNSTTVGATCTSDACTPGGSYLCYNGDTGNCGNSLHGEWICTAHGVCTPDASCAANTYIGNTCVDSCGNVYAGTKALACVPDGSCAASTNVGSTCYDSCGNAYAGTYVAACTPDSSCAASTNVGSTCYDSCGNGYAGTKPVSCTPDSSCAANTCTTTTCSDSCGNTYAGTKTTGSCVVSPPACTNPTVSITAIPTRIASGGTVSLKVTGTGINTICWITNQSGTTVGSTQASSCNVNSNTITTPPMTSQTTYTVSCDSGAATAKVIVNVNPVFNPF